MPKGHPLLYRQQTRAGRASIHPAAIRKAGLNPIDGILATAMSVALPVICTGFALGFALGFAPGIAEPRSESSEDQMVNNRALITNSAYMIRKRWDT